MTPSPHAATERLFETAAVVIAVLAPLSPFLTIILCLLAMKGDIHG